MPGSECNGKTRKGEKCKNFAMLNSSYCYVHSFWKLKNIPFYKNMTFHLTILGIIITVIFFIIQMKYGATKENQEKIIQTLKEIQNKRLEEEYQIYKDSLLQKYPLGFVMFTIDKDRNFSIPKNDMLKEKYRLDISNIKFIVTETYLIINIPEFNYNGARIQYIKLGVPRKQGFKNKELFFNELRITPEILLDDELGIICIIGFREVPIEILDKQLGKEK